MKINFIKSARPCLLAMLLLFVFNFRADGQIESFPDYFTFYNPTSTTNPWGADTASKAILTYLRNVSDTGKTMGTMFLINTFRDDDTICVCMAGHQVRSLYPDGNIVPGPFRRNSEVYMNYLGEDTIVTFFGTSYSIVKTTRRSKAAINGGELVAYYDTPDVSDSLSPDIALLLLDKRQLPVSSYATLGYDFSNSDWETNQYYSINHPHFYPQRIQDNYTFEWNGGSRIAVATSLPFAVGSGSSGGPIIRRPPGMEDPWYVQGVACQARRSAGGFLHDRFNETDLSYSTYLYFTKIAAIEKEIKQHCWKNKDSSEIIRNNLHRKPVWVNNAANTAPYGLKRMISGVSDVTAAGYTGPVKKQILSSYVKGDQCDISAFTLPAIYPGSTNFWQVTVAAKEIMVGTDFSYTPADQSELNLSTVIIDGGPSVGLFRKADSTPSVADKMMHKAAAEFKVYPNPSSDGAFRIALPDTGRYSIAVYNLEGKKIYESSCTENPFSLQLPQTARGNYVLQVSATGSEKLVYTQLISY